MNSKAIKNCAWMTLVALIPWLGVATMQVSAAKVDFAREIAPVLKSKCGNCHGAEDPAGGLRLDTVDGIRKGGVTGKLWEPFKSADSLLVKRLRGQGGPRMPMGFAPLPDETIAKVSAWIDQGGVLVEPTKVRHWAYTAPVRPSLPPTRDRSWTRNSLDRFILARLEKEGLRPSSEASKETLARRASLDLTGLPPTVAELDSFLADTKPRAYERYVDRLLASPHYGERMARIWLDLARYADTNGYEKDLPRQLWAWRDWVINAFNKDMPYDEFTIEQLAGDLLPKPTRDQLVATGFHRNSMLNDEGGIDTEEFRVVAVIDRVDATATTWLGSTLACAQCHDHKYDPFSQRDYYSFFAFFNQSEDNGRDTTPILRLPSAQQQKELDSLQAEIATAKREIREKTPAALVQAAQWKQRLTNGWLIPKPAAKAEGANLKILEDNSILASGPDPKADIYTIRIPAGQVKSLAGLRIEAIPDGSLPEHSSGRNFNGNFVVRRVEASILHQDGAQTPVAFKTAKADFTQEDFDPQSTIVAGDGLGWAIAAFQPENRVHHSIVFSCPPVELNPQDNLVVTIRHQTRFPNHNLGRFRISLTEDRQLAAATPPRAEIVDILAKPSDKRTKPEEAKLTDYYTSMSPELSEVKSRLARLQKTYDGIENTAPTTMVMHDLTKARPNSILKRGDFRTPGDTVTPASPKILGNAVTRQDRLGLAKWLVDPKNPLTARVEMNRLWEQCFGRGLVATPEDFGTQGDPPSHPELLDWLATELVAQKWSMKAMLREIVTSATYRQSSRTTEALTRKDPNNVLLARGPRFRVEAETVRDIALTASGRLTPTIGGPSVMPPQPPGIWENSFTFYDTKDRWKDDMGPNRYRRGLYTYWRRTAPYPMELTFDLKSRDMCVAHRSRSNSPLQALNVLNDPVFVECAGALGIKMSRQGDVTRRDASPGALAKGITFGFRACTSQRPSPHELSVLTKVYAEAVDNFNHTDGRATQFLRAAGIQAKEELTVENAAWIVVANTILNLDETITKN